MKGLSLLLMVLWCALLSAIALDSFGPTHGSWFEPIGLGFLPVLWATVTDYITQYIPSGVAFFSFWIGSSLIMFRPSVLERFITRKTPVHG